MLEWKKDWWKAIICLAPMLILMGVFTFYPIVNTIISSFRYYQKVIISPGNIRYVLSGGGFAEYGKVFSDYKFWRSIGVTALLAIISVPISIATALLISVLLCKCKKLKGVFQTIFFLPYVTNGIAFGMVFASIFASNGLVNGLFRTTINWIGDKGGMNNTVAFWAGVFVIVVHSVWNGLAFKILVFVGGIEGINKQYYQAAELDGASRWRVFRKITLPLLSPMVLYISITSLIGALKAYSSIVSIYGETMGNGSDETFMTAVGYIYSSFNTVTGSNQIQMLPKACASAVVLFIFIMIITGFQMLYNKRRVHY